MTFMFGSCDSVPIRLSVRPSLKYSLFESLVALTKGNTAMESTLPGADFPRKKYQPQAIAMTTTAATPAHKYLRKALAAIGAAAVAGDELDDKALAGTAALCERPESRSRFRRAKSVRRSAAF